MYTHGKWWWDEWVLVRDDELNHSIFFSFSLKVLKVSSGPQKLTLIWWGTYMVNEDGMSECWRGMMNSFFSVFFFVKSFKSPLKTSKPYTNLMRYVHGKWWWDEWVLARDGELILFNVYMPLVRLYLHTGTHSHQAITSLESTAKMLIKYLFPPFKNTPNFYDQHTQYTSAERGGVYTSAESVCVCGGGGGRESSINWNKRLYVTYTHIHILSFITIFHLDLFDCMLVLFSCLMLSYSESQKEEGLLPDSVVPCGGCEMCSIVTVCWECDECFGVSVVCCLP